jgi:hypothetical protein
LRASVNTGPSAVDTCHPNEGLHHGYRSFTTHATRNVRKAESPDLRPLLQRYVWAADTVARRYGLPHGWCITAAALSREVLTRLGVPGVRVLGVDFAALSPLAWKLHCDGVPAGLWPEDAWLSGVQGSDAHDETGWDGHAIAYIPSKVDGRTAWIVDPSAGQFSSPERQIALPPLFVRVPTELLSGNTAFVPFRDGGVAVRRNLTLTHHVHSRPPQSRSSRSWRIRCRRSWTTQEMRAARRCIWSVPWTGGVPDGW